MVDPTSPKASPDRRAKLAEQQARGEAARAIVDHPLVRDAFEKIEAEIVKGWQQTKGDEAQQRENAYMLWRAMQRFRDHFKHLVLTGDAAGKQLLNLKD